MGEVRLLLLKKGQKGVTNFTLKKSNYLSEIDN